MKKLELVDDHYCFVCGMENVEGLRLKWTVEGLSTTSEFVPDRKYQGWQGILHGGIIATLLDEAMTRLSCIISGGSLTAEMTVRFVAPAYIGKRLLIRGEVVNQRRKILEMKAFIHSETGVLIAYSTGKAVKIGTLLSSC